MSWGAFMMLGAVAQIPARVLSLGFRLGASCLHLLSLGLWALLLGLLLPVRGALLCAGTLGEAVRSAAHQGRVYGVYSVLQGLACCSQLARGWVLAHARLYCLLLDALQRLSVLPLCEQAARWLVRAGVRAGSGLAGVRGVATFVQLCVHTLFLGLYLSAHVCFAAISSKVRVRVHAPFFLSVPFRVHAPLSLGIKVRVPRPGPERVKAEVGGPPREEIVVERKAQKPNSPAPRRRRSLSRNRLSPWVVPSAATLIIVVCVGFLVLMVVLGLVRIHSLHRRVAGSSGPPGAVSDLKDPDLFWDDSALTIIVNPMESYQGRQTCGARAAGAPQEDEDSSDSDAADSPSSDERRIIETPPHRY